MAKVLCEMPTGMGGVWQLRQYSGDFYGFGTKNELDSLWGAGVNNYGTKEEVIKRLERLTVIVSDEIEKFKNDHFKKYYTLEKEMLIKFAKVLKGE